MMRQVISWIVVLAVAMNVVATPLIAAELSATKGKCCCAARGDDPAGCKCACCEHRLAARRAEASAAAANVPSCCRHKASPQRTSADDEAQAPSSADRAAAVDSATTAPAAHEGRCHCHSAPSAPATPVPAVPASTSGVNLKSLCADAALVPSISAGAIVQRPVLARDEGPPNAPARPVRVLLAVWLI